MPILESAFRAGHGLRESVSVGGRNVYLDQSPLAPGFPAGMTDFGLSSGANWLAMCKLTSQTCVYVIQ